MEYTAAKGITHTSVWRSDIDEECNNGTAAWMYDVLAKWIAVGEREE